MAYDNELVELRDRVDCRAVLEHAGWLVDKAASSRRAVKYRRGAGEIIVVTHEGKGWFEPLAEASCGDVIALAQRLWGGNIGHARKALRPLAGIAPSGLILPGRPTQPHHDTDRAWGDARVLAPNSPAWRYLTDDRHLPPSALTELVRQDLVREGVRGTAWFAHRVDGRVVGWEMRGPSYKGFSAGGTKSVFAMAYNTAPSVVAVCESAIDAISLGVIDGFDRATAYVSTGGGWGDAGRSGLARLLPSAQHLVAATDLGTGGDLLADRVRRLADDTGKRFERRKPVEKDWNQQLSTQSRPWGSMDVRGDRAS